MALLKSEGAGSVWILVHLPGTHLYTQVLGNLRTSRLLVGPPHFHRILALIAKQWGMQTGRQRLAPGGWVNMIFAEKSKTFGLNFACHII